MRQVQGLDACEIRMPRILRNRMVHYCELHTAPHFSDVAGETRTGEPAETEKGVGI